MTNRQLRLISVNRVWTLWTLHRTVPSRMKVWPARLRVINLPFDRNTIRQIDRLHHLISIDTRPASNRHFNLAPLPILDTTLHRMVQPRSHPHQLDHGIMLRVMLLRTIIHIITLNHLKWVYSGPVRPLRPWRRGLVDRSIRVGQFTAPSSNRRGGYRRRGIGGGRTVRRSAGSRLLRHRAKQGVEALSRQEGGSYEHMLDALGKVDERLASSTIEV